MSVCIAGAEPSHEEEQGTYEWNTGDKALNPFSLVHIICHIPNRTKDADEYADNEKQYCKYVSHCWSLIWCCLQSNGGHKARRLFAVALNALVSPFSLFFRRNIFDVLLLTFIKHNMPYFFAGKINFAQVNHTHPAVVLGVIVKNLTLGVPRCCPQSRTS